MYFSDHFKRFGFEQQPLLLHNRSFQYDKTQKTEGSIHHKRAKPQYNKSDHLNLNTVLDRIS